MHPLLHVSSHPLVQHKITLASDKRTEPALFRALIAELSQLLIYEATADLPTRSLRYETPMQTAEGAFIDARIGLVPIMRAGIGMVDAALTLLPNATVYYLGIFRDHDTHEPVSYYNKLPKRMPCDIALVLDPMLATGGSASAAVQVLKERGVPEITFIGIVAAPEGVACMAEAHPDVPLHLARLDEHLDANKYIRPGLGDAGDRLYGTFA